MEQLNRESVYRHRSERLIDRFLVRAEKKQAEEIRERLQQLEKIRNFKTSQKRQKQLEEEQKKNTDDQKKKEQDERKEKYAGIDHYGALCKIIKHMYNSKKFSKCLSMIQKLFKEYFDFFDGNTLFNTLDAIMRYDKKFEAKEDRQIIEELYFQYIEFSQQDDSLFTEEQEILLDLFYVPVYIQSNLYTDDSFKFNEVVREVTEMYESLSLYHQKQDQFLDLCTSQETIQTYFQDKKDQKEEFLAKSKFIYEQVLDQEKEEDQQFNHFVNGFKRRMFFETLKQIFQFNKFTWAKTSIKQTLKKIYLEKEKLNEDEIEQLEDMISALKSMTSMGLKSLQNRERLDDKIKTNPLESFHEVKDARAERVMLGENGVTKWASKQTGLTWSDNR